MNFAMILTFMLGLVGSVGHAETLVVQFEDIPQIVRERNSHAQGADFRKRASEIEQGHLARSYLPRLKFTIGTERFQTGTQAERAEHYGSVIASTNIFRGGKDRLEDVVAQSSLSVAVAESEKILREEVKKARISFWHLVAQREMVGLLQAASEENQKNLVKAEARIRAGVATETDRIEFEMYRLELNQDLLRLRLASENTERNLAVLLGLPEGTTVQTPLVVGHKHEDDLFTSTELIEVHPAIRSLIFRGEESRIKALQSGRWWTPSLDLYASYGLHTFREREFALQSERYETVVGMQLTMELFDGFAGRTEFRHKTLETAGLQLEALQTARELHAKVAGARAELRLTHELIHHSEEALLRAKIYLARTLDEYQRGVKNSPEVLLASERRFGMLRRFADLRRDYQLARCELLEILGK